MIPMSNVWQCCLAPGTLWAPCNLGLYRSRFIVSVIGLMGTGGGSGPVPKKASSTADGWHLDSFGNRTLSKAEHTKVAKRFKFIYWLKSQRSLGNKCAAHVSWGWIKALEYPRVYVPNIFSIHFLFESTTSGEIAVGVAGPVCDNWK